MQCPHERLVHDDLADLGPPGPCGAAAAAAALGTSSLGARPAMISRPMHVDEIGADAHVIDRRRLDDAVVVLEPDHVDRKAPAHRRAGPRHAEHVRIAQELRLDRVAARDRIGAAQHHGEPILFLEAERRVAM